jgi:hypothetical protein
MRLSFCIPVLLVFGLIFFQVFSMIFLKSRIEREQITVGKMIDLYCRLNHKTNGTLCDDCGSLKAYAMMRLDKCPFHDEKPTCVNCPIHCYKKDQREMIKKIMRFSGPKMLLYHPVFAIWHLIDNKKKKEVERKLKVKAKETQADSSPITDKITVE